MLKCTDALVVQNWQNEKRTNMQHLIDIKQNWEEFATILPNNRDATTPSRLTNLANSDFAGLILAENRRNRPRTWLRAGGVHRT
jgi:hypothetical protein